MTNGLPSPEAQNQPGQPAEPTPVQPGKEALEATAQQEARETVDLKWGNDVRTVDAERFRELSREAGVSPDALRTWIQLGRDAGSIYQTSRQREQELSRREMEIERREREIKESLTRRQETPMVQARPRVSVTENPVQFWEHIAEKVEKLDNVDRLDRIEQMLEATNKRYEEEREEINNYQMEQQFISEHKTYMDELKRMDPDLPQVDVQTIASALDRVVTEIPQGTSMRELIEYGYKIVTWDDIGRIRANREKERQSKPRAAIPMPSASPNNSLPETQPNKNETLEERRARLHRAIGGVTFQELHRLEGQ